MFRGINKQILFEDEEDYEKFLQVLKECREKSGFELYAYCLMGNHAHILLKVGNEGIEQIVKRIGVRYVYWYNWKYGRSGHLFQDRYKSEPVDSEAYFLTVLRYIHRNPVKAGICKTAEEYRWSSYGYYLGKPGITDTAFALELSGIRYNAEDSGEQCLDIEDGARRLTDKEALEIIRKLCKVGNARELQNLDVKKRDRYIAAMKEKGLSIRQIERLTGISFGIIRKL
jgi:REP element-mobilizing transposase RayT